MAKKAFDVNTLSEVEVMEIAEILLRREMNPFAAGGNPTPYTPEQEAQIKARAEQIFPDRYIRWRTLPLH
jgi:hypothetical protein